MSEDDDQPNIGFAFRVAPSDREIMELRSREDRLYHFLDGLDTDDLLALQDILRHDSNLVFVGYVMSRLRALGVNPRSGLTFEEEAMREVMTKERDQS